MLDEVLEGKDVIIKDDDRTNVLMKCNMDREDCVSFRVPSVFLPHVMNLRTRFLFSRGELSHP